MMDKADAYRSEINRLVEEQHLPVCPYDGKPCHRNMTCYASFFGCLGDDVLVCPRFKGDV
jgi:hypothetical protein